MESIAFTCDTFQKKVTSELEFPSRALSHKEKCNQLFPGLKKGRFILYMTNFP